MEIPAVIIWSVLLVLFIIVEAATAQLVTIWFAIGSFAALITSVLKAPVWLQITVFVVVSIIALIATRPLVKKFTKTTVKPLNANRCIGQTAVVTETIDNINATGAVKHESLVWTARSSDGSIIEKGTVVTIEKIDGVKLIVKNIKED